jgi:hypothetical protein
LQGINSVRVKNIFDETLQRKIWQNSYISPGVYKDMNGINHVLFFSGGGNLELATCSDGFLHDIKMKNEENDFSSFSYETIHTVIPVNTARADYASFLLNDDGDYYYIIHGGISCDFSKIFSDVYIVLANRHNEIFIPEQNILLPS